MTALDLLRLMTSKKASDLFVTANAPPSLKIDGQLLPIKTASLTGIDTKRIAFSLMDEEQQRSFEREKDAQVCVVCLPRREIGQNGLSLRERRESKMNLNK